jgi:ferredoxin
MTQLTCDALVIGAGAAGATVAATLAEGGFGSVVLVEKGPYYDASFFNQRELDMSILRADRGRRTTADGAYPVQSGECVGGGTTVNFALCFDPVPAVWRRWRDEFGVAGFSLDERAADYGIPGLNLAAAVRDVRRRIDVRPVPATAVNENNRLFARGAAALDIEVKPFELNMRGCIGCGFCGQGCAYDAKRGTLVTYVPDALARGVRLVHHCEVERLVFTAGPHGVRAAGARGTVRTTVSGSRANMVEAGPIAIEARIVVLAAGAAASPALLQRSASPIRTTWSDAAWFSIRAFPSAASSITWSTVTAESRAHTTAMRSARLTVMCWSVSLTSRSISHSRSRGLLTSIGRSCTRSGRLQASELCSSTHLRPTTVSCGTPRQSDSRCNTYFQLPTRHDFGAVPKRRFA